MPRRLARHEQAMPAEAAQSPQHPVEVARWRGGHLEGGGDIGVVAEPVQLLRVGDHALPRREAHVATPEATVKAPSTHSKVSLIRWEWGVTAPPGASVISATTRAPPLSSDVSRIVMVSPVPGLPTVR